MDNMLTLTHVAKRFGTKEVLKDLSFEVPEHTIFGFVGKNGAGKTTAMKLILGLLSCDSGQILVNGEPVHYGDTKTNQFIGYLPDVPEFYSFMTPVEYLHFCGEIAGMKDGEIRSRSEHLLQLVGLGEEKRRIKGFSRGMKQRLGVAQALLGRPKLLICDEPTSALDPVGRKELLDILVAAKEETTVLFSTHILSDVEHICDEIAFLNDGRIALLGTLEEVKKMHKGVSMEIQLEKAEDAGKMAETFCYLKKTKNTSSCLLLENQEKLPEILYYIAENKISLLRLERCEPTLEELFVEVTV